MDKVNVSNKGNGMVGSKMGGTDDRSTGTGSNGRKASIEGFGGGAKPSGCGCEVVGKKPGSPVTGFSGGEIGGKV